MPAGLDYAALRVQLEHKLRAARVALRGQEISAETAADLALLEQAVDVGTQDLIQRAAVLCGLLAPEPAPAAPAPSGDGEPASQGGKPAQAADPQAPAPGPGAGASGT